MKTIWCLLEETIAATVKKSTFQVQSFISLYLVVCNMQSSDTLNPMAMCIYIRPIFSYESCRKILPLFPEFEYHMAKSSLVLWKSNLHVGPNNFDEK